MQVSAFIAIALGLSALFGAFDIGSDLPGDFTNAHPVIHDFKMNAGGNNVSAD